MSPAARGTSRRGARFFERLESRTFCAAVESGPDLAASAYTHVSGPFMGGDTGRTVVIALNMPTADTAAPANTMALYLSSDRNVDTSDRQIARARVRPLRVDRRALVSFHRFTIPRDMPPGRYEVLARIDETDAVNEESEANNVSWQGTVTVVAPYVDLVPVAIKRVIVRPRFRSAGVQGVATVLVWNVGTMAFTGTPVVRAFASNDGVLPLLPNLMVYPPVQPVTVRPGSSAKVRVPFESLASGLNFVLFISIDSPSDPTPNQAASAMARYRRR